MSRLDGAVLDQAAARLGIDLGNRDQVMNLVAVAATRLAWRDGPVEDWHAVPHCRIGDADIMRANAATTRLLRMVLDGVGTEPVDDRDRGVDPLFATIGWALTNVDRRLPDGRTVAELAPDAVQLAAFERHVWTLCTGWSRVGAEYGAQQIMALLAVYAGRYCWRWWLATGWPDVVGEFVRRLDEPSRWRDPEMVRQVTRVGVPDIGGGELRDLLLAGPDRLTAATAAHCLRVGLGDVLPQDCGRPGLPRHALPPQYLRLVALPEVWNPGPT